MSYPININLFKMNGLVSEIIEMTERNAAHPNLPIAFMGAITFLGNIMGARYRSAGNIAPNMYNVVIAQSGTGKDAPRQTNKMIASIAKRDGGDAEPVKIEIFENIASYEGVESIFKAGRNDLLLQIDEVDALFNCLGDKRNTVFINMMKNLLSVYTSSMSSTYIRINKANTDCKEIPFPNISIFGSCTPEAFYSAMQEIMIERGLISRCLILPAFERSRYHEPERIVNFRTIDKIKQICSKPYAQSYEELNLIDYTPDARMLAIDLNNKIDDLMEATNNKVKRILYSRIYEKVVKLAMVNAVSENCENPVINAKMFTQCTELVIQAVNWMAGDFEANMYNNDVEKRSKRLLDALKTLDEKNKITRNDIYSHFKSSKSELDVLIPNLIDMGLLEKVASATGQYYALTVKALNQ